MPDGGGNDVAVLHLHSIPHHGRLHTCMGRSWSPHTAVTQSMCQPYPGALTSISAPLQVLAAEVVALEESRIATRAAELRASAAARDASEQVQSSRAQVARLASEREALAAAVSSLQVLQTPAHACTLYIDPLSKVETVYATCILRQMSCAPAD